MILQHELLQLLKRYAAEEGADFETALACATADLRHIADKCAVDYAHADALGWSHYCEEDGQTQTA